MEGTPRTFRSCLLFLLQSKSPMALRNAAATITGRCGGIGTSIARRLASRGQPVVLYDLSEEHGRTAVQNIEAAGGQALFLKRDVGSESDWKYISAYFSRPTPLTLKPDNV